MTNHDPGTGSTPGPDTDLHTPAVPGAIGTAPQADAISRSETDPGTGAGDPGGWDPVRLARAVLGWLTEPGDRAVGARVRAVGPVRTLAELRAGAAPPGVMRAAGARLGAAEPSVVAARAVREAERLGCRMVVPEDDEWPRQVDDLHRVARAGDLDRDDPFGGAPIALWVRGSVRVAEALDRAVAVVGARAATPYGEHVAAELAYGLADRGWAVVSGGAYGIDAAAHRGALAADGMTAAVLAGGIDIGYPAGNAGLFERIGAGGLLISEWPPGAAPARHRFLVRNRVIAALCRGTVVVEAAARSGARNTARRTRELGRMLMAVPGPVTSAMSVGTHQLIRQDDARLVCSVAEVLEEVGRIGADLAPLPHGPATPRDGLEPLAVRVLDAVPLRCSGTVGEIAVRAGVPPGDVRRTLPLLVLKDLVVEAPGGYRLAPAASRASPAAGPAPPLR